MRSEPNTPIYLDHHATTPMDEAVFEEMKPYFTDHFGNPASDDHTFGAEAKQATERARKRIAKVLNCRTEEIIFTSGATESDNLAIRGVAEVAKSNGKGDHIITSKIEHKAVLESCGALEQKGFEVTYLPVDKGGLINLHDLEESIRDTTILISIMAANNEIGTIAPLKKLGGIAKSEGVLFHTDAVQALGYLPLDVKEMGIDLMSISGHKIYGPKGVGALFVRRRNPKVKINPLIYGGGHERGWRSGTLNVPGIVGFGKAAELAGKRMQERRDHVKHLSFRMRELLDEHLVDVTLNGDPTNRIPNNLNISFKGVENKALVKNLQPEVAVSAGSACTAGSVEASHVLQEITNNQDIWHSAIRFGFGKDNTEEEIYYAADKIIHVVNRLRKLTF